MAIWFSTTAFQAEIRRFEPVSCEIGFEIYHKLSLKINIVRKPAHGNACEMWEKAALSLDAVYSRQPNGSSKSRGKLNSGGDVVWQWKKNVAHFYVCVYHRNVWTDYHDSWIGCTSIVAIRQGTLQQTKSTEIRLYLMLFLRHRFKLIKANRPLSLTCSPWMESAKRFIRCFDVRTCCLIRPPCLWRLFNS